MSGKPIVLPDLIWETMVCEAHPDRVWPHQQPDFFGATHRCVGPGRSPRNDEQREVLVASALAQGVGDYEARAYYYDGTSE